MQRWPRAICRPPRNGGDPDAAGNAGRPVRPTGWTRIMMAGRVRACREWGPRPASGADHTMQLTGAQLKAFQAALLAAFPTRAALEQLVAHELEQSLAAITEGGPLEAT